VTCLVLLCLSIKHKTQNEFGSSEERSGFILLFFSVTRANSDFIRQPPRPHFFSHLEHKASRTSIMENEILSSALRRLCEAPGRLLSASEVITNLSASELLSKKGGDLLLHAEAKIGNDDNCWILLCRAEETACLTEMVATLNDDGKTAFRLLVMEVISSLYGSF